MGSAEAVETSRVFAEVELAQMAERPGYTTLQFDNDLFAGSDRGYTNGVRLAQLTPLPVDSLNGLQRAMAGLHNRLSGFGVATGLLEGREAPVQVDWGTGFTQLMYTPDEYEARVPGVGDRPYAGWLGMELSLHVRGVSRSSTLTLVVGLTGPNSLAQDAQDWVHKNISNSEIFDGWDSQVSEEITVNLQFGVKQRLDFLVRGLEHDLETDAYVEWGAAVGNFRTEAYLGGLFRFGGNLPLTYMTPRVQLGTYSSPLLQEAGQLEQLGDWSWCGFVGVRGTAVGHDITLDGPVFRDYRYSRDSQPVVGEVMGGIGIRYKRVQLVVTRTLRSEEFETQSGNHEYGSVMLGLIY
jgi:hypothetical protein